MKRFWHSWLALIAAAAMISPAVAQTGYNGSSPIGSYQSILSRAGYQTDVPAPAQPRMPAAANVAPMDHMSAPVQDMTAPGTLGGYSTPGSVHYPGPTGGSYGGDMGWTDYTACGGGDAGCGTGNCGGYNYGGYTDYGGGDCWTDGIGGGLKGMGFCGSFRNMFRGNSCEPKNYVFGLSALYFQRDYEDGRFLSSDGAGARYYSDDADHGTMNGIEASLTRRGCNGYGWQMLYWGIPQEDVQIQSAAGPLTSQLTGLDQVYFGAADVYSIYNAGTVHTFARSSEINNFELNMLRNAGRFGDCGQCGTYEFIAGFRYFNFDERFNFSTDYPGSTPPTLDYDIEVENQLYGFQVGGRREYCKGRMNFGLGTNVGIFNNRAESNQSIISGGGAYPTYIAGPNAGTDFNFNDRKNDVAIIGQIDASLIMCISERARARIGYRALGVSGVALAVDQIPYDFTDVQKLESVNTNGELMLHGGYFGIEIAR
ncbi:MAG: BBP7 family outer membrane beta-barrel protein [Planctomycetota bacterium]